MANLFKTTREVLEEMLAEYKNITGIDLSPSDLNREEVIKMMTYAGMFSMFRADLQRVHDDCFPASSSEEALEKHLAERQLPERAQAQPATGVIRHTGVNGTAIPTGVQIKRKLDGRIYISISTGTITGGYADVTYQSLLTGSAQNLDKLDQDFELLTPRTGVDSECTNETQFLSGRDKETAAEMLERIQAHDRDEDTGGNLPAYERWAREASAQVVTATAIKNPRGGGTVDTIITSGTTDIEAAIENGDAVLRLPSSDLIDTVQAYIELNNPTTDNHQTIAPTEAAHNVTVSYELYDETLRSLVDAQITKIVKTYIYQAKPGQTIFPTELERRIDSSVGHLISERRVSDLGPSTVGYTVPNDKLLTPGTITLQAFS